MLKLIVAATSLVVLSLTSQAQTIYTWRDANGVMNYSDTPPTISRNTVLTTTTKPSPLGVTIQPITSGPIAATPSDSTTAIPGTSATGGPITSGGTPTFPRLMGMNIGGRLYENAGYQADLARLDVAILGFYRGWNPGAYASSPTLAIQKAVRAIKAINPNILVGNYTILNEEYDNLNVAATLPEQNKLNAENWWLRNSAGQKVQWTTQWAKWEVNFTEWTKPDANGKRYPQWKAEYDFSTFFRDIPEFDIWYQDNVFVRPRVTADWDLNGTNDDPNSAVMLSAHYAGHRAHWDHIRTLDPNIMLIANTADTDLSNVQWRGQLEGGFMEGLMGQSWSMETWGGWPMMMKFYRDQMANLKNSPILGFNVWGSPTNYRFFRYAYTSCLLDDGYFAFTDLSNVYNSVPWFDEYNLKLGNAVSAPPTTAWSNSVWRRDFQNGIVLVNPTTTSRTVGVGAGYRKLAGTQDAAVNNGATVTEVTLGPKDGIVLRR